MILQLSSRCLRISERDLDASGPMDTYSIDEVKGNDLSCAHSLVSFREQYLSLIRGWKPRGDDAVFAMVPVKNSSIINA